MNGFSIKSEPIQPIPYRTAWFGSGRYSVVVATVGSFPPVTIPGSAPSQTGLQADVDACRRQMADWVTCPSANTPEGKARIAQIAARMSAAESRIKTVAAQPAATAATRPATTTSSLVDVYA